MGKIGAYQPTEQYKNYSLPTSKPLSSHAFYKEKVWTVQEQIYKKLKKVAEYLESLYPNLTDDFNKNIKVVIEKNLETLIDDLDLMQRGLHKNPESFNTKKLKINQHCITEMKNVCDTLQTVSSYEHEFKKLGKIKHTLNELEHLIQPTSFEKSLEKARIKKPKTVHAKKERTPADAKKKTKEKSTVKTKKPKTLPKEVKATTKLAKPIKKVSTKLQKSEAPLSKLKQPAKKVTKPKPKLPAGHKKVSTAKSKPQIKSSAVNKKKLSH